MLNPDDPANLQVVTVTDVLTQGMKLQVPALITQIESAATVRTLKATLQAGFPLDYPVMLLKVQSVDAQRWPTSIAKMADQDGIAYPISLYLPAQISATAVAVQRCVDVVAQLRSPEKGCPWDLAQTPQSLIPYLIEEAYETIDAIEQGDVGAIAEELGDLLLQVVLQAQIASESQDFSLREVAEGITEKLIRRHPHVFGDVKVNSIDEVHANWEQIKATEKQEHPDQPEILSQKMQRYARSLPPLMAGLKLSQKAAASGLEWQNMEGVWAKFYEELAEFQEALLQSDFEHQQEEFGDLIFTLINVARWCQIDPSVALRRTNTKLISRVSQVEANADQSKSLEDHTLEELEELWQQAKQQEQAQGRDLDQAEELELESSSPLQESELHEDSHGIDPKIP